eukprot:6998162-Prymnesium_polylepis.1
MKRRGGAHNCRPGHKDPEDPKVRGREHKVPKGAAVSSHCAQQLAKPIARTHVSGGTSSGSLQDRRW